MSLKASETDIPLSCILSNKNTLQEECRIETVKDGGKVLPAIDTLRDQDPFGDESEAVVKYKTMTWW